MVVVVGATVVVTDAVVVAGTAVVATGAADVVADATTSELPPQAITRKIELASSSSIRIIGSNTCL